MEQSQFSQSNFKTRGEIKLLINNDGVKSELFQKNFTLNMALESIADLCLGLWDGTLYRMGLGTGGADSFGNRIYPDDTWHSKTSMVAGIYSKDFIPLPVGPPHGVNRYTSGNTVAIEFVTLFDSDDLIGQGYPAIVDVSEILLIQGKNTAGNQFSTGSGVLGLDDRAFAYRTFDEQSFNPGAGTTIEAHWTIFIEKV